MKSIRNLLFLLILMTILVSKSQANDCDTLGTNMTASINKSTRTLTLVCSIINSTDNDIGIPVSDWYIEGFKNKFGVRMRQYYYVNRIECGQVSLIGDGFLNYQSKFVPKMIFVQSGDTANLKVIVKDIDTANLPTGKINVNLAYTYLEMIMEMWHLFLNSKTEENIELEPSEQYIIELKYNEKRLANSKYSNVKMNKTLSTCLRMAFLKKLKFAGELKIK